MNSKFPRYAIKAMVPLAAVVCLVAARVAVAKGRSPSPGKPNVIIIYSDDVGYGDISSYGAHSISTPHIDQLAEQGIRFTNAYSDAATCTPSRYSILTGRYAWRKKGSGIAPGNAPLIIDSKRTTIADVMTKHAVRFIKKNQHHPFFLYFASHDVHVPRVPDRRFVGKSGMGPRGDELLELDWEVGRIEHTLKRLHLTKNTLIIFSSDNGPVLDDGYEDGAVQGARQPITTPYNKDLLPSRQANQSRAFLPRHKPAGPLRGGKYSIFEGGTRIPFIVKWPGHTKKGMVSHALISQVDLLASFAALTHQKLAKTAGPDSFNMLPALLGKATNGRDEIVEQTNARPPLALVQGKWKYIAPDHKRKYNKETNTELGNSPKPQLYNLQKDVGEQHNLASKHPRKVKEMALKLKQLNYRK